MHSPSDEEEHENDDWNQAQFRKTAVLLVDCHDVKSLQIALKAAFNYFDSTVMTNHGKQIYLDLLLCHPDIDKQTIVDSKTNAVDAYQLLFKLSRMSEADLEVNYKVTDANEKPFSSYLLNAMKLITDQNTSIMYATSISDPCLDEQDRLQTMAHFINLQYCGNPFKVFALSDTLDFSVFYDEVYDTLDQKKYHKYFDVNTLGEKLLDAIHIKEHTKCFNLFPYPECPNPLKVYSLNVVKKYPYRAPVAIHNTTRQLLTQEQRPPEHPLNAKTGYFVRLGKDGQMSVEISEAEYKEAQRLDDIPKGITLMQAKPLAERPYSIKGLGLHKTMLLGADSKDPSAFRSLWAAMKDLRLLCLCKFTDPRVFWAEMVPVLVEDTCHFLLRFIPQKTEIFANKIGGDVPKLKTTDLRQDVLDELIDAFQIDSWETVLHTMVPPRVQREAEYVKKELLGSAYQQEKVIDYPEMKLYRGEDLQIEKCCKALELHSKSEREVKKRKR